MRFPTVTETFILREMIELERQGLSIELYVPIPGNEPVVHPDAAPYQARMHTAGYTSPAVIVANLGWLVRKPLTYLALWLETLTQLWGTWNFLVRDLLLLPKAAAFARKMEQQGIAHLHAHYATHTAFMAYMIWRLTGIGYSFTAHAHDIYIRRAMLCRKVRAARFVATISHFNREWLARECGEDTRDKIHIIRCGISPEQFRPRTPSHRDNGGLFRVLTVASLRDYKGIPVLVEACALAKERIPTLQWEVIGTGPDRTQIEALIAARNVGDVLHLAGSQPEGMVAERMQAADAFVISSIVLPNQRMEGLPVVLMEALASELPTIATNISGIPELVIDGETGYLVPERDPQAIADALVALYNDPDEGRLRGQRGRQLVLKGFAIENNTARLRELFEHALSGEDQ
jgi:glycosyltransferase involved in cell wall biosynthesis